MELCPTQANFFILPEIEISQRNSKVILAKNYLQKPQRQESISFSITNKNICEKIYLLQKEQIPDLPSWENLIRQARDITELKKIVLARKTIYEFQGSPYSVLRNIHRSYSSSYIFGLFFSNRSAFLGASPERLYKRERNKIYTEALAGTTRRGKTSFEDQTLSQQLLESKKDLIEFNYVKLDIEKRLKTLASLDKTSDKISIYKTPSLQHLYCPFKITKDVPDVTLLKLLHPTPAIGGLPKDIALKFIKEFEPFDRGLYSCPIGIFSKELSEVAVAIRSVLINQDTLHLFTGVGIVDDSDPKNEFDELDSKKSAILQGVLNGIFSYSR